MMRGRTSSTSSSVGGWEIFIIQSCRSFLVKKRAEETRRWFNSAHILAKEKRRMKNCRIEKSLKFSRVMLEATPCPNDDDTLTSIWASEKQFSFCSAFCTISSANLHSLCCSVLLWGALLKFKFWILSFHSYPAVLSFYCAFLSHRLSTTKMSWPRQVEFSVECRREI